MGYENVEGRGYGLLDFRVLTQVVFDLQAFVI